MQSRRSLKYHSLFSILTCSSKLSCEPEINLIECIMIIDSRFKYERWCNELGEYSRFEAGSVDCSIVFVVLMSYHDFCWIFLYFSKVRRVLVHVQMPKWVNSSLVYIFVTFNMKLESDIRRWVCGKFSHFSNKWCRKITDFYLPVMCVRISKLVFLEWFNVINQNQDTLPTSLTDHAKWHILLVRRNKF